MSRIVLLLVVVLVLPGCLGGGAKVISSLETAYQFQRFNWPAPEYHDGKGVPMGAAAFPGPKEAPRVVERLLLNGAYAAVQSPPSTYAPPFAVSKQGTLMTSVQDHLFGSSDSGKSWKQLQELNSVQYPTTPDRMETFGNAMWADQGTGRTFAGHLLTLACQALLYTDDGGKTWKDSPGAGWPASCGDDRHVPFISGGIRVFSGPHGPASLLPGVYPSAVYFCETIQAAGPRCSVSQDGGDSFAYTAAVSPPSTNCMTVTVGKAGVHKDGTALLPLGYDMVLQNLVSPASCVQPPRVAVSADDGRTWEVKTFTNKSFTNNEMVPSLATGAGGTSFLAFRGPDHLTYLLRSKDKFATWEGPFRVSPPSHTMAYLSTVSVGDDGRLSVAYLGTQTPQKEPGLRPTDVNEDTQWHLFVTTTYNALDENPSFVTVQVTPREDPVETGRMYPGANMGVYLDSGVDADGRFYVSFIDGCNPRNGCTADTDGAFAANDHEVAIAVQDEGPALRGTGLLAALGLQHEAPTKAAPK